jgi:hypothetical protein
MPACGSTISDGPAGATVLVVAGAVLVVALADVVVLPLCAAVVVVELLSLTAVVHPAVNVAVQRNSPRRYDRLNVLDSPSDTSTPYGCIGRQWAISLASRRALRTYASDGLWVVTR